MRVYVSGGSGFVGSNVVRVFTEHLGADVFVPVRSWRPSDASGEVRHRWDVVDVFDPTAVRASVLAERPDAIVHCAILNDFDAMVADRRRAWAAYVGSTRALALAADEVGAKLVLVSTDWVFDGTQHLADESTPPNPVNLYGVLKMASEIVALEVGRGAAVARVSGVNGVHWARPEAPRAQDRGFGYFVVSLVDALRAGRRFTVWDGPDVNLVATPSLASESAFMMAGLIDRDCAGIFHCCGGEAVDRLDLAHRAATAFGLDASLIESGPPDPDVMPGVPVPVDTSLSADHTAEVLGYRLPGVDAVLAELRSQLETGFITSLGDRS